MSVVVKSVIRNPKGTYLLTLATTGKIPAAWTDSQRMVAVKSFSDAIVEASREGAI